MTLFDLIFLLTVLSTAVALVVAMCAFFTGRRGRAARVVRRLGLGLVVYAAMLLVVSIATPQRRIDLTQPQCSDDWCITVDSVQAEPGPTIATYAVHFRLINRARRVAQRERFVAVYLQGADGRRIDPSPEADAVPFDTLLQAGQTIPATRRFAVPRGENVAGVVVTREGGFGFPRCCVIGDDDSFLHRRTLVSLARP